MAGLVVADKLDEALRRIEDMEGEFEGLKDARSAAVERSRAVETMLADRLNTAAERLESLNEQLVSGD